MSSPCRSTGFACGCSRREARSVEPRAHALAQVKLVNPQEQVAGRDQGAVYAAHEVTDLYLGHLLQGAPLLAAILAFVAVGQLFEHTSILRIEEGDGHGGGRKHGQERDAVHLEADAPESPGGSDRYGWADVVGIGGRISRNADLSIPA